MAFAMGLGEPSGDGGMSKFGTGGSVKSCTSARDVEKEENRPSGERMLSGGILRGCEGPSTGPMGSALAGGAGRGLLFSNGGCANIKDQNLHLNQLTIEKHTADVFWLRLFRKLLFGLGLKAALANYHTPKVYYIPVPLMLVKESRPLPRLRYCFDTHQVQAWSLFQ